VPRDLVFASRADNSDSWHIICALAGQVAGCRYFALTAWPSPCQRRCQCGARKGQTGSAMPLAILPPHQAGRHAAGQLGKPSPCAIRISRLFPCSQGRATDRCQCNWILSVASGKPPVLVCNVARHGPRAANLTRNLCFAVPSGGRRPAEAVSLEGGLAAKPAAHGPFPNAKVRLIAGSRRRVRCRAGAPRRLAAGRAAGSRPGQFMLDNYYQA
jgi:hypothetical protein